MPIALADVHLGRLAAMDTTRPLARVTAHLNLDYISSASIGRG